MRASGQPAKQLARVAQPLLLADARRPGEVTLGYAVVAPLDQALRVVRGVAGAYLTSPISVAALLVAPPLR